MKTKSVQSNNPTKSVIQTIYDIVKAHGGELNVNSKYDEGQPAGKAGTEFIIQIPA